MLSVPFFSPDNVFRLKKPVISFNKKPPSQQTPNPEKEHKASQAAQSCREIDAKEMEPFSANQEGSECSNGVSGNGWKDIFHKRAQAQKKIDEKIGERIERIKEAVQIGHVLFTLGSY